ncbi:hypothetical protein [Achromobacter aloeverae]|uniref:Uncharacterized protein n=1 Tax=Achromobacter aloeverae TaxID=1750518 RepID=A0A4Q1HH56_9BURK|nr:hypothetical protein [Achromobacter aloeverae]RXN85897.1 hypothetical protein C7R54_19195 [Achromobacter aloeverae]
MSEIFEAIKDFSRDRHEWAVELELRSPALRASHPSAADRVTGGQADTRGFLGLLLPMLVAWVVMVIAAVLAIWA